MRIVKTLSVAVVVLVAGDSHAANYTIEGGADTAYFRSSATLEFIEGKTNAVDGSLTFDPEAPEQTAGMVRVDLASLKTGIGLRDQHMRENHLETEKYPYAYYEITRVKGLIVTLQPGQEVEAYVEGWFYIHGVKRQQGAEVAVTLEVDGSDTTLVVDGRFDIKLDDYDIDRPKALFMKLAETIEVVVKITAIPSGKAANLSLPDWPQKN